MTGKREFPLAQVYGLLEPGPVVLLSTSSAGRLNVMPMSWHTMMESVPPLVECVVSSANYTFEVLRQTGECVINIPTVALPSGPCRVWALAQRNPSVSCPSTQGLGH